MSRRLGSMLGSVCWRSGSGAISALRAAPAACQLPVAPLQAVLAAGHIRLRQAGKPWSRTFASRASEPLLAVLDDEIRHEEGSYQAPAAGLFGEWSVVDGKEETTLVLTRSDYLGERITVEVDIDGVDEEEDLEEQAAPAEAGEEEAALPAPSSTLFDVMVVKGKEKLTFQCRYTIEPGEQDNNDASYLEIEHVGLGSVAEDGNLYDGPVFAELDEKLQAEWDAYLAERGITPELGQHLVELAADKEQQLYMRWLKRVAAFVRS